jgi:hypothetical protein
VRKATKKFKITSPQTNIQNQIVTEVIPQFSAHTFSGLQFLICIELLYLDTKNTSGIYLPWTKIWREEIVDKRFINTGAEIST